MKQPRLSKRLEAIVNQVCCKVLADIGTDHGYTPAAACELGRARSGIACDVSRGSLKKAEDYIRKRNLSDRVETRLGYGFDPIQPGEADMAVISGMGGMLTLDIIRKGLIIVKSLNRLILGPQRDLPALRRGLFEMGVVIINEYMLIDGKQFYNILICEPGPPEPLTPEGCMFGQPLIDRADPVLKLFLLHRIDINTRICRQAENKALSEEIRLASLVLQMKGWA